MMRVLVTGANGFVGRPVLEALAGRGDCEVEAVSSRPQAAEGARIRWHSANLFDAGRVRELLSGTRPSHLLHLAWDTTPGRYWTSLDNYRWVQASLELVREFHVAGGLRFVATGTCAEYDWQYGYCTERITPLRPNTPYGICKNALHAMLEEYARQTGLSAAWAYIFFPYGPREPAPRLVPSVIRALLCGEPANCTSGTQVRDLLYVDDAADALVHLLTSDVSGPVNISSGKPVALRDVVYCIADALGRRDLVRLGALPDRPNDPPMLVADVRRLSVECQWAPHYDLQAGLDRTIRWWQEQTKDPG
jgi:nucleoside-diphosphate-sugar epimerase